MTLKKKIILMVMVLCLVVCTVIAALLPPAETKPELIEPPFKNMYWGITLEEAEALLEKAGIDEVALGEESDPFREVERWMLTAEQAEALGYTVPGGLEISEERELPVYLGFCSAKSDDILRLVSVSIMAQVPDGYAAANEEKQEYVRMELSKTYGPTFENWDMLYWALGVEDISRPAYWPNLNAVVDRRTDGRQILLCYDGNGYLSRLMDSEKEYRDVSGDLGITDVIDEPNLANP